MSEETRKVAAIRYPLGFDPGGVGMNSADRRHNYLVATLGGAPQVRVSNPIFATLDFNDTINFPSDHDRSGFPRYDWVQQPNGCSFGYLKEEAQPS